MIGNKKWFEEFKKTTSGVNIYLGDDGGYQIKSYGMFFLEIFGETFCRQILCLQFKA